MKTSAWRQLENYGRLNKQRYIIIHIFCDVNNVIMPCLPGGNFRAVCLDTITYSVSVISGGIVPIISAER